MEFRQSNVGRSNDSIMVGLALKSFAQGYIGVIAVSKGPRFITKL